MNHRIKATVKITDWIMLWFDIIYGVRIITVFIRGSSCRLQYHKISGSIFSNYPFTHAIGFTLATFRARFA